jgi:hypothetical protein
VVQILGDGAKMQMPACSIFITDPDEEDMTTACRFFVFGK